MSVVLSRVDERLVHGRVINDWIAEIKPSHLVIADDTFAEERFMAKIYKALVPIWLNVESLPCSLAAEHIKSINNEENRIFILAKSPKSFAMLVKKGVKISEITFADKKYQKNRLEVSDIDKRAINMLISYGIKLYSINTPLDNKIPIEIYDIERTK